MHSLSLKHTNTFSHSNTQNTDTVIFNTHRHTDSNILYLKNTHTHTRKLTQRFTLIHTLIFLPDSHTRTYKCILKHATDFQIYVCAHMFTYKPIHTYTDCHRLMDLTHTNPHPQNTQQRIRFFLRYGKSIISGSTFFSTTCARET